jgi:hypothetical protein
MNVLPTLGSPLNARQNPILYYPIIAGIIIIALVGALFLLWRLIRKLLKLPPPVNRERRRRTRAGDIRLAETTYRLSDTESDFLTKLCKQYRVPNIYYFFQNALKTYELFARAYADIVSSDSGSPTLTPLFSVMEKVNRHRLAVSGMRSTQIIPVGQEVSLMPKGKGRLTMTLKGNNERELRFSLPLDSGGHQVLPPELSKVTISYETRDTTLVSIPLRILNYETRNGIEELVAAHSTNIFSYIRQEYRYVRINLKCTYQVVKKQSDPATGEIQYLPQGDELPAVLMNYSGKSCNLSTSGAAPALRDYLCIQCQFESAERLYAAVLGAANIAGSHIIHTDFVQMDDRAKNYILARVNGFAGQEAPQKA